MELSQKLQLARMDKKLTQAEVARTLHVSRKTVSGWENNRSFPDANNLVELSDLYNVPLDTLMRDDQLLQHYSEENRISDHTAKLNHFAYWMALFWLLVQYAEMFKFIGFHFSLNTLLSLLGNIYYLITYGEWDRLKSRKARLFMALTFIVSFIINLYINSFSNAFISMFSENQLDFDVGLAFGRIILILLMSLNCTILLNLPYKR